MLWNCLYSRSGIIVYYQIIIINDLAPLLKSFDFYRTPWWIESLSKRYHPEAINFKNGNSNKSVVLCYDPTYFTTTKQTDKSFYTEQHVISMLEFLLDNFCASLSSTGTSCARSWPICLLIHTNLKFCERQLSRLKKLNH